MIGNAPSVSFNLTPFDTAQLFEAGISEKMIKLMVARESVRAWLTNGIGPSSDNLGTPQHVHIPRSIASGPLRNAVFFPDQGAGSSGGGLGTRDALIAPQSTPVRLRLTRNLTSSQTKMDDIVHFEVLEDG
jgi:hypothetical protein